MSRIFHVYATFDEEERVYVATSDDLTGLVVEARTLDGVKAKISEVLPDLIGLNGIRVSDGDRLELIENSSLAELSAA